MARTTQTEIVVEGVHERHPYHAGFEYVLDFMAGLHEDPKPDRAKIYCFYDKSNVPRIAEIDFTWARPKGGMSGSSYMRSDPEAAGVILLAEDLAQHHKTAAYVMFMDGGGPTGKDPMIEDYRADLKWRLDFLVRGDVAVGHYTCIRCDSPLTADPLAVDDSPRCTDETCPYSDHPQGSLEERTGDE